jgi:hypothetical protein
MLLSALALGLPVLTPVAAQDLGVQPESDFVTQGRDEGVPWLSGGVGIDERKRLMEKASDYNLKLEFAVAGGAYLGDVNVRIDEVGGNTALDVKSDGPWFMAKLPPGSYKVTVSGFDQTFEETVQVPASGMKTVVFNQWTKPEVREATPSPTY